MPPCRHISVSSLSWSIDRLNDRCSSDHPIHPPTETSDPWDIEFPPDRSANCIRQIDGVFNVFATEVSLKCKQTNL